MKLVGIELEASRDYLPAVRCHDAKGLFLELYVYVP